MIYTRSIRTVSVDVDDSLTYYDNFASKYSVTDGGSHYSSLSSINKVVHAEVNAILNKCSASVRGATIYVALFPCVRTKIAYIFIYA